jgi:hypothetical protein
MNIFVVDENPVVAAQSLCDKHIVKMILESGEMLCHAIKSTGETTFYMSDRHKNHPCTIWTRTSKANWNWLHTHAIALCEEYTRRYGKTHSWEERIRQLETPALPQVGLTEFARAIKKNLYPEFIDESITTVEAYRRYYRTDKERFARWKEPSTPPSWW